MSVTDAGVELRPATPDDVAGIDRVVRDAFGAEDPSEGDKVATLWAAVRGGDDLLAETVAVSGVGSWATWG